MKGAARTLLLLAIATLVIVGLQEVPLPPSFWAHGLRARIAEDYSVLRVPVPWLPVSMAPYESLSALLALIPPLAMFVGIVRLNAYRPSWLAAALIMATVAGIMVGTLQVASADPKSPWYPYPETNFGSAVGFFANANHMATLLLVNLPFLAALAAAGRGRNFQSYSALVALLSAVALVLIAGIALNGSLAGYTLVVPVLCVSAIIILRPGSIWRRVAVGLAALSILGATVALVTSSIGSPSGKMSRSATTAVQSRAVILTTTAKAIGDTMPWGSGLGSFLKVYRLYEDPDSVTTEYVIHAHNDYVEVALELGVAGIILMLAFLGWWAVAVWAVWRSGEPRPFAHAASIASATVLIHSVVDFPLRTSAIGACFAMCLGLLADRQERPARERAELRPVRHLVFR